MNKYFIFGDCHGDFLALTQSLDKAGFEVDNPKHFIIGLGDYFDRGDRNGQVYNFLSAGELSGRVYLVYGNHDAILKGFLMGHNNGVFDTIYNGFGKTIGNFAQIKVNIDMLGYNPEFYIRKMNKNYPKMMDFLNSMEDGFVLDNYIFTHGGFSQINKYQRWEKPIWKLDHWADTQYFIDNFKTEDVSDTLVGKIFVLGHWHARRLREAFSMMPSDRAFQYKNYIGLDASTNSSGFVNILVIESENLPKKLEY